MSSTLAGTDLPPSAVHAIIEIGSSSMHAITASSLCQVLNLEKSSISRMVQKLVSRGLVVETKSGKDGREKHLKLTEKGMEVLVQINEFAEEQVESALECLSSAATALEGIRTYASALRAQRLGHEIALTLPKASGKDIDVIRGYRSGIVGRCLEMHMAYYSRTAGFGSFFEATVARGLGDLCVRLEEKGNDVWAAMDGEKIVGTIWVDGQDLGRDGKKAHLRAFIVSDEVRGGGVGRRLIEKAVEFVDEKEFQETHLWTFKGLEAARRLYVECGFEMVDEKVGKQWGKEVTEQHFVRKIGGLAASSDSDVKIS
jgi:DNA-binding MarR family transcriptional regulator/GNAT superfamily N-acetyltransferase